MIVLDAAALVDVVLDQPPKAWVLEQLVGERVCAPAHQRAEVLSAIARLERGGELSAAVARDALDEVLDLEVELVPLTVEVVRRAFELRGRIRVLDGLYVALAEDRACPLVTTDGRLAGAKPPCDVRHPSADPKG